jgi:hypothetical protein
MMRWPKPTRSDEDVQISKGAKAKNEVDKVSNMQQATHYFEHQSSPYHQSDSEGLFQLMENIVPLNHMYE